MAERALPTRDQYPNNSNTAKERLKEAQKIEQKNVTKVTTGRVIQKKKPFGKRFAEAFGAAEGQGIVEYILYDIIIPATKNMIVDSIIDGAEMAILGETRGRYRRPADRRSGRYPYDRVSYRDDRRERDARPDPYENRRRSGLRDYEEIVYSRDDAERVLDGLLELISAYGQATVIDLYDLSGITPPDYTVGNYGWTNLAQARVIHTRDGYILDLPPCSLLRRD